MEDENEISDQNSIISSYFIDSLSDSNDENEEKECSYSSSSSDNNNSNDKEHKLKKLYNYLKCHLCSNNDEKLKYCKKCKALYCEKCINKKSNSCNFCNIRLYEIKCLNDIRKVLKNAHNNYIINKKLIKENKRLVKLTEEKECKKCFIHNQKIAYYCFNCHKKLCGICYSFFNDEAKIHEGHNVNDYSLVEQYKINEIIDGLEYNEELKNRVDETITFYKKTLKNINILFNDLNSKVKQAQKKYIEKINMNLNSLIDLKKYKEKNCKFIYNKLNNIKSLENENPEFDFDISKTITDLKNISIKYKDLEKNAKNMAKLNSSSIHLNSFFYSLIYKHEHNSSPIKIKLSTTLQFFLSIQEEKNNNISMIVPYCIENKSKKQKNILFPVLINHDFGEFKKERKNLNKNKITQSNSNIIQAQIDEHDENPIFTYDKVKLEDFNDNNIWENEIIINDDEFDDSYFEYKLYIDLNKLNNDDKFNFIFHYYTLNN